MNDEAPAVATPSQTAGPFFHLGLRPQPEAGAQARIRVLVSVIDGDGRPVDDAMIELWHSLAVAEPSGPAAFARLATDKDGSCEFETARPVGTADGRGVVQAAHLNVCLFARGLLRQLHTRIYFAGDPALESDAVMSLVPEHRRSTLIATRDPIPPGRWLFEIRLQEPRETVFFDV